MDEDKRDARERRRRSIVLALTLVAFAILVFAMSVVKWGELATH